VVEALRAMSDTEVSVSTITVAELEYGIAKSSAPKGIGRRRISFWHHSSWWRSMKRQPSAMVRFGPISNGSARRSGHGFADPRPDAPGVVSNLSTTRPNLASNRATR
jgi:predicted nucleic acid-binding protein